MSGNGGGLRRAIQVFTIVGAVGLVLLIVGVVLAFTLGDAGGVGAAMAGVGFLLAAVGIRERYRGRRMLVEVDEPRAAGHEAAGDDQSREDRVRKWRRLEVGNTIGGAVAAIVVLVFVNGWLAACLVGLLALGVADTWLLGRRLRRTGRLGGPTRAGP